MGDCDVVAGKKGFCAEGHGLRGGKREGRREGKEGENLN